MAANEFTIDFLTDKQNYYLSDNNNVKFDKVENLELGEIALYKINEISYEEEGQQKAPRKEALENVLSTMKIEGVNFIYLLLGDSCGVRFYYGVSRNQKVSDESMDLNIHDIGKYILEPSIKGNFRGSCIEQVKPDDKQQIVDEISNMKYYSMLEGVPGYTKDDEKFQGVDRLVDVMLGDTFGYMIIASPASYDDVKLIEKNLYEIYTRIVPLSKQNIQKGEGTNSGRSTSKTYSVSSSVGGNYSRSTQEGISITSSINRGDNTGEGTNYSFSDSSSNGDSYESNGTSSSAGKNRSYGTSGSEGISDAVNTGNSSSQGQNSSHSDSRGVSEQTSIGKNISNNTSIEYIDKKAQDWIKYLDDVIIPRLDYGMGKGIFVTTSFLFSSNKASLKKLENTAISLYSGEKGNKVPLKAVRLSPFKDYKALGALKNFQLPSGKISSSAGKTEPIYRTALSQFVANDKGFNVGNWITTNELAMIAGLPKKEVVGLTLKEEVDFGLNFKSKKIDDKDKITLGKLVQSGNVIDEISVSLDKNSLDKHIFITGVTGSGKTTTCHKILIDSDLPFLVIEPAKTEYRILKKKYDDILVFTLGKDTTAPFRLNPFEFFKHESITSRVDMIKASIEAAFDMEAAIPQIIESAIYKSYEDYGWDIATNKNTIYGDRAFEDGVYAFPTLQDLIYNVDIVVKKQGFGDRLEKEYLGSIKARLMGLVVGAKGLMLNTNRSIDFKDLLSKRVVLELEEIRSGAEKSLVMGFVLTNLMEAIKGRFLEQGRFEHITLVEEAHRLLSKYVPGDSPNRKLGVETFSDMLAEIRKYGECLMIVDQIPNKLTPEVLKNTNTKIVHRLFAEDDKDAIGNTIVLNKEQKDFLSKLETGRTIVFSEGFNKAVQVRINNVTNTTGEESVDEDEIRDCAYHYYYENRRKGMLCGSHLIQNATEDDIKKLFELSKHKMFSNCITKLCDYIPDKLTSIEGMIEVDECIEKICENGIDNIFEVLSNSRDCKNTCAVFKKKIDIMKEFYDIKVVINCIVCTFFAKSRLALTEKKYKDSGKLISMLILCENCDEFGNEKINELQNIARNIIK